ncbi:hypothetical protein [Nocardia aurantia]|uniref:Uncharacterized protein n=1 Tax=Nocardia aurantia TaxID=2585199 RepID=A0A7K0DIT2_9NOCA|nr:hypothetical protein [Nocardia aurantia]MQY25491.1 hypothetical protein [Nocardia aurantia]
MTNPGWQNQQNANRQAMDALHRARRTADDSARLARGGSPGGCAITLIALVIVIVIAVIAAPIALDIIRHTGH